MKRFLPLSFCLLLSLFSLAQVRVLHLKTENTVTPLAVDAEQPRFSWQLQSNARHVLQSAYELTVTTDAAGKHPVWKSGRVSSDSSVLVAYKGAPLQAGQRYHWQVRVWDNKGKASTPAASWFQMGIHPRDWTASWISPGYQEDSFSRPSPIFRKQFSLGKKVQSATAYITAHGVYEAYINGQRVGDAYLTPGWTAYDKRLQYQAYDVTDLLKSGPNAVGAMLGSGWYRGFIGFTNQRNAYGKDIALLFQLNINYTDGTSERVVSDGSWKSSTGSVRYSEIYHGETVDARQEKDGWTTPSFKDADWQGVTVQNFPKDVLIATYNEPIRKQETFRPVKVLTTPKGEQVIDFGQNLVGWVVVKARGVAGDQIVLQHAEVLDKEGNFYTENLRAAHASDTFYLRGGVEETFEPHFTFHGFRYIRVIGYPGELRPENFTAVALYSDMRPTGSFTSSHPLINQLQHNIQWGQRGNFLDVPTDCPQRDERLGWTGDAQVFARTASFNMDVHNFLAKWMKDVAADQRPDGSVPFVVPNVLGANAGGSAGWADVATIIPWNLYLAYGDKRVLEDQYPSMKAWVEFMRGKSRNDLWNTGFHFGDWLFYRPFDDNDGRSAVTDKYLIAQCFYAHSTQLLVNAAKVLGKTEDVALYSDLLQRIKSAFIREYMTPSGRLVSGTQTAYVLALNFDMLPENLRASSAQRLAANVKDYGNHLTTGFLGTPYLCHVLTKFGYDSTAYQLLLQETYPSWLYPVKMGATTIWERWDGQKPDGTFQTPSMNSFNHYAYGAIGDWMYRVVAGLDTDEGAPGYKKIVIRPVPGGGLTHASAQLQTLYGPAGSSWRREGGRLLLDVEIPANTTATVYLPAKSAAAVTESGRPLSALREIGQEGSDGRALRLRLGSGKYQFAVTE